MIKIEVNSVRGRILNCPDKLARKINKFCSYRAYNYQFSDAYINGHWDGYVRKFSIKTRTFPSGLLYRISKIIEKEGIGCSITDRRKKFNWTKERVLKNLEGFKFSLRPYQIEGLITGLRIPYLVFWWATSAGKTVQFAALISALREKEYRNTLILVANRDLASQHRKELGSMLDTSIGLIEEGRFEPKKITVAVINTLWQRAIKGKNKQVLSYLEGIEHLISDETHHIIDSKMFKQTINKCINTIARHGFSGTPFSLTTDDVELESVTGPPLSRVTMSQLIEEGWVSTPHIFMIRYDSSPIGRTYNYASLYSQGIVKNAVRNRIITEVVSGEYFNSESVSILVLIRIIEHGKLIRDLLLEEGIDRDQIEYIHGSTPGFVREEVKDKFKRKDIRIVIASSIWSEGIDIPTVDVLFKADGGGGKEITEDKGIRAVIQNVGRVIRKPIKNGELDVDTEQENIVRIYDLFDGANSVLASQSMNRFMTFKMEKKFIVKEVRYDPGKSKAPFI